MKIREKNECARDRLLTENFNRCWCVKTTCSSSGIPEDVWNKLLKFGLIQNVRGDGSYGVYAAFDGLINCLIPVSTKVKTFRKKVRDFIDNNRDKVLCNFSFKGKKPKNGKMRGIIRNSWLEDDVMKRMWDEGSRYIPRASKNIGLRQIGTSL